MRVDSQFRRRGKVGIRLPERIPVGDDSTTGAGVDDLQPHRLDEDEQAEDDQHRHGDHPGQPPDREYGHEQRSDREHDQRKPQRPVEILACRDPRHPRPDHEHRDNDPERTGSETMQARQGIDRRRRQHGRADHDGRRSLLRVVVVQFLPSRQQREQPVGRSPVERQRVDDQRHPGEERDRVRARHEGERQQDEQQPCRRDRVAAVRVVVVDQRRDQLFDPERVVVIPAGEPVIVAGAEVRLPVDRKPGQKRGRIQRGPEQAEGKARGDPGQRPPNSTADFRECQGAVKAIPPNDQGSVICALPKPAGQHLAVGEPADPDPCQATRPAP